MSENFYSVGLQNVGSYQVSGRPWLKDISLSLGTRTLLEFPNVTNQIEISNDLAGNGATSILDVMFCEPKRAIKFNATNEYYETTFSSLNELTVSIWVKPGATTASQRIIDFIGPGGNTGIRSAGSSQLRLLIDSAASALSTYSLSANVWVNLTLVLKDGDSKLFIDGELSSAVSSAAFSSVTGFEIGDHVGAFSLDGTYDEIALYSTALSDQEVATIWNSGGIIKPAHPSLISYWAFEDNNYKTFYSSPDILGSVLDRVSGNDLTLVGPTANVSFVDGRLIENAEARHKIQLVGGESITLQCKAKQILLSCPDGHGGATATDLAVCASLTGIPAGRMFELSGTGIDE